MFPLTRLAFAGFLSFAVAVFGLLRRSVTWSGAVMGFLVGLALTASHVAFFVDLLIFFLMGTACTRLKAARKRKIEANYRAEGGRSWLNVVCNAGAATITACLYASEAEGFDLPINFPKYPVASLLNIATMASLAAANGDTLASEVGSVLNSAPRLITTYRKVPAGTNGAVSVVGLAASLFGGLTIGLTHFLIISVICSLRGDFAPPQWPLVLLGGIAGVVGGALDSFLGATIQYSGIDKERGFITEVPGPSVRHISGWNIVSNHTVNLIATSAMAIVIPAVGFSAWQAMA